MSWQQFSAGLGSMGHLKELVNLFYRLPPTRFSGLTSSSTRLCASSIWRVATENLKRLPEKHDRDFVVINLKPIWWLVGLFRAGCLLRFRFEPHKKSETSCGLSFRSWLLTWWSICICLLRQLRKTVDGHSGFMFGRSNANSDKSVATKQDWILGWRAKVLTWVHACFFFEKALLLLLDFQALSVKEETVNEWSLFG